jgi:FkbM family methyltransferase
MATSSWQSFEEEHLKRFFSHFKVDCVFDVGANRGQYRALIRDRIGFKGPIISFEPVPFLVSQLNGIKTRANDANWHIENIALDRTAGEAEFNVMANNTFSSLKPPSHAAVSIFRDMNKIQDVIQVKKEKLSDQYEKYKTLLKFKRPFLKMDTQGNDVAVFEGAEPSIKEFVGLQSELSIRKIYENTLYYYEVMDFYSRNGFTLSAMVPNNAGHFPDLIEIDCIMYRR